MPPEARYRLPCRPSKIARAFLALILTASIWTSLSGMSKQVSQDEAAARKQSDAKALAEAENSRKPCASQQEVTGISRYGSISIPPRHSGRNSLRGGTGRSRTSAGHRPAESDRKIQKDLIEKLINYRNYRDARPAKQRRTEAQGEVDEGCHSLCR